MASPMSFPDIHSCTLFAAENVELKKRLQKVRQQRDELLKELNILKEKKKTEELLRNYVTTRDVYVQTEPRTWSVSRHGQSLKLSNKMEADKETEKTNKLLSMHSQLMKRYEKEVKQNIEHVEAISNLNVRLTEQEAKLREERQKVLRLEAELASGRGPRSKSTDQELREVVREKTKLKKENKKLRAELDGLDENFFDEIEDIKFAFQQSARLNKEYEKALRKLCQNFGVPYPHPEHNVLKSRPN